MTVETKGTEKKKSDSIQKGIAKNVKTQVAKSEAKVSNPKVVIKVANGDKKSRLGTKIAVKALMTTSKRKRAVCKLWMWKPEEDAKFLVNGKLYTDYFSCSPEYVKIAVQPFSVTEDDYQSYCIVAEVLGGGVSAQSEALRLGISKLLCMFNPSVKTLLRKAGLLTRDARIVEPKKTGQPKARKKEQYSKR